MRILLYSISVLAGVDIQIDSIYNIEYENRALRQLNVGWRLGDSKSSLQSIVKWLVGDWGTRNPLYSRWLGTTNPLSVVKGLVGDSKSPFFSLQSVVKWLQLNGCKEDCKSSLQSIVKCWLGTNQHWKSPQLGRHGRVVRRRTANPRSPVRILGVA